jgi:hypothetical protein
MMPVREQQAPPSAIRKESQTMPEPRVSQRQPRTAGPFFGLISVAFGTLGAIALVPANPEPAGALFASAVVLTLGLLAPPAYTAFHSLRSVLRIENMLLAGLVYWLLLDLIQGLYDLQGVTQYGVQMGFGAVGLFAGGIWSAMLHRALPLPRPITEPARVEVSIQLLLAGLVVCFLLGFLRYAIPCGFDPMVMLDGLGRDRFSAPWARGAQGGWDAFVDHLSYFAFLLPSLTVLVAYRMQSWTQPPVLLGITFTAIMTPFLAQGGNRRIIGVIFGSAILSWVILNRNRLRMRILVISAIAILCLLIGMEWLLEIRNRGFGQVAAPAGASRYDFKHIRVDDSIYRLVQIIEIIPERHDYVHLQFVIWVLIRPIPRVFWPGKPLDPGFNLAVVLGLPGVSLTSSVIGELYMSVGFLAVLLGGWVFGSLAGMWNQLLGFRTGNAVLMYGFGAMCLFAGLRSMIELVLMSYTLLAWLGVSYLIKPGADTSADFLGSR